MSTTTVAQYRAKLSYKLNTSITNSTELTQIDAWLNEAYEDILLRTQCKVEHGQVSTTAEEWRYDLPTAALDIIELWLEDDDGHTVAFERTSSRHILRLRAGLETETGSPLRFFATEGANMFMVWPTPEGVSTINLLYVPRPVALSATSDTPSSVPSEFHKALEYYALWQAADGNDDASSKGGEYYRALYEGVDGMGGILDRLRKHNQRRGGRRLAPIDWSKTLVAGNPSSDIG